MEITENDLKLLKKFKDDLSSYHDIANSVYSVSNGHEYMSDIEFKNLRLRERTARDDLNEQYGATEKLIDSLLGGKPYIKFPGVSGGWDVFSLALSSTFTLPKGEALNQMEDEMSRVYGKAKGLVGKPRKTPMVQPNRWFSKELLARITDQKVKKLCEELDQVAASSPNAAALLMRTILLITLQKKIGKAAKDDLGPVLSQAISQDVYGDDHIKRILTNLSSIPKTMLDATHHSKWILIKPDDIGIWMTGLVNVIEVSYPDR